MRVLITGSNGQLGSEINDLAVNYKNVECIFKDLPVQDELPVRFCHKTGR
jgi:dTDP-4-dehydrorhamnose reductase